MTAIGMCLDNGLPIIVFNYKREGNIERVVAGESIGTWVSDRPRPSTGWPAEPPLGTMIPVRSGSRRSARPTATHPPPGPTP